MSRRLSAFGVVIVCWCVCHALASPSSTLARQGIRVAVESAVAADMDATTLRAMTDSMHHNLRGQAGVQVVSRQDADFVLWGSVTRLSNRVAAGEREIDCKVSVIVADARGGSIRFTLAGHAVARGDLHSNALAADAMSAAVRGALKPLERGLVAVQQR